MNELSEYCIIKVGQTSLKEVKLYRYLGVVQFFNYQTTCK